MRKPYKTRWSLRHEVQALNIQALMSETGLASYADQTAGRESYLETI